MELLNVPSKSFVSSVYRLNKMGRYEEALLKVKENTSLFSKCEEFSYSGSNVILVGGSRIGKSLLADKVSIKIDAPVIRMDVYRRFYWSATEKYKEIPDIISCRKFFYRFIFEKFPAGVVFEGSDFYFHVLDDGLKSIVGDVYFLGLSSKDVERKESQVRRSSLDGHCRSLKSETEALIITKNLYKATKKMKALADSNEGCMFVDMMRGDDIIESANIALDAFCETLQQEVMVNEDALYRHGKLLSLNENQDVSIKLHERVILEYGSKYVSTIATSTSDRFIMCVEANRKTVRELIKRQHSFMSSAVIFHANISDNGSATHKYGESRSYESSSYISDIWNQPFFRQPDLILLSGPMKLAAFKAILKHIKRPTRLLFDDFIDEPERHIIERVLPPVRVMGTWAEFSLLPGIAQANVAEGLGDNDERREQRETD